MSSPPSSIDTCLQAVSAVNARLRAGNPPPGTAGNSKVKGAISAAADDLGINRHTLRGRLDTAKKDYGLEPDWAGRGATKPKIRVQAEPTVDPVSEVEPGNAGETARLNDTIRKLRKQLKDFQKEEAAEEVVREAIFGLSRECLSVPDWVVEPQPARHGPGIPVTLWSDWHFSEVVRAAEVAGVNEYSPAIAVQRAKILVERIIDVCFSHMVCPEYPGIVVCLGGDMISGDIHDELSETNEIPTAPALLELAGLLAGCLSTLADHFGKVFVPAVVGNHGRMTHRPRAKRRVHTSYEWLLYCQLEKHFQNDPRVKFLIPGETDAHFAVYGHRYMLTHGDSTGVKGGDGIIGLLGPVARGAIKTRVSEAQIGRDFDTVVMGHWHQTLWLPGVVVGGTLKGYDEYARLFLRARYQPPQQSLWFVHPKHGPTYHVPIYLEDHQKADTPWVTWQDS